MTDRPPGGGTFSLEGRPVPGLYLFAWLLSGVGLALVFVAFGAAPPVSGVLLMAGLLALLAGLATAAGYQVVARRARPADAYRGPSPLLVLAIWFVVVQLLGALLFALGIRDTDQPGSFFAVATLQVIAYLGVVWLFVVRSGGLSFGEMGLRLRGRTKETIGDAVSAAGLMVPVTFAALVLAILVALALGTRAPEVVPAPQTGVEILLVALGAVLLIPIGEEVFFRGYALTAWLRDLGPRSALIRSTLFFAAVHIANVRSETFDGGLRQALLVLAVIIPVGAVLGWLMLRRGLVAAIAGHMTYNGILILLLVLAQHLPTQAG